MAKKPRTTIKTVAEDAGVSVSAVSKVLRNAYGVSESLREKVQASIEKLGYRPNIAARSMRGRTFTIGLLVSDLRNPFVPDLIDGVREEADRLGYRIMIGVGRSDRSNERDLVESMLDQQMDGLILIGPRLNRNEVENYGKQVPTVCLAYHHADAVGFDTVNADDASGAKLAMEQLIAKGHKRITMVSLNTYKGGYEANVFAQREIGYHAAMDAAGLSEHVDIYRLPDPIRRDPNWAEDFMAHLSRPSAIFCWSDLDAISLINAVQSAGLMVGKDISLVGFDNSTTAALPQIGLSSIDQDGLELGKRAFHTLFSRIEGRSEPVHLLLETRFIERQSIGKPND